MRRQNVLPLLASALLSACGDAEPPTASDAEPELPPAVVEEYLPAVHDAVLRILPTGEHGELMQQLGNELTRLTTSLSEGTAAGALHWLQMAQRTLDACDDACLIPPERSVVQLVLDQGARLLEASSIR